MKNKHSKKRVLLLMVCVLVCMLTACTTKLKGTYTSTEGLVRQSFTFEEDTVGVSAFGIEVEGDYVIEDGVITITYNLLGFNYSIEKSFEKDGKSIFIDGVEFVKED